MHETRAHYRIQMIRCTLSKFVGSQLWSRHLISMFLVIAILLCSAQGTAQTKTLTSSDLEAFGDFIETAMQDFDVSGAAVAVLQDGLPVYIETFGTRGIMDKRPVNKNTRFAIGSLTKSMTATMLATLVDDGVLAFDDKVENLWPGFSMNSPNAAPTIELADLLSHMTGVAELDVSLAHTALGPLNTVATAMTLPVIDPPHTAYHYNNQMFALAGYIGALSAGAKQTSHSLSRKYQALMQKRVFNAVGMPRTTMHFHQVAFDRNHAWPSSYNSKVGSVTPIPLTFERAFTSIAPAGAIWSSIDDMARYVQMQMNNGLGPKGQQVASAASLLDTHTPRISISDTKTAALGWNVATRPWGSLITHGGTTYGFGSKIYMAKKDGWALVFLTNRQMGQFLTSAAYLYLEELLYELPHAGYKILLEQEQSERLLYDSLLDMTEPVPQELMEQVKGRYEQNIEILQWGRKLFIKGPYGRMELLAVTGHPNLLAVVDQPGYAQMIRFSEKDNGLYAAITDFEMQQPPFVLKHLNDTCPPRCHRKR